MIPYGRQTIGDDDVRAVVEALRSDFLTQGPLVPRFERAVAQHCGVPHAVAVNSATSALHVACLALGVGPGDRVWTSPNTFVASANCARFCGASVDFVDIDPHSYNLCTRALAAKLESAASAGELPKVVIPVHFAGLPCDLAGISELARRYHFHVIEDASHAIGARYQDSIIGDCRFSDITVFSFHPVKIITTGEGGMATTRDPQLARAMQLRRSHGVTRESSELHCGDQGAWYYEQQCLGFNYRMTEIQAALGLAQLPHLSEWVARRHELADAYDAALCALPVIIPARPSGSRSALHLYVIQIDAARTDRSRRLVFDRLRAAGIEAHVHYIPVHLHPDFQSLGFRAGAYPQAEAYYARCLTLPMFASLTAADQSRVIDALGAALT